MAPRISYDDQGKIHVFYIDLGGDVAHASNASGSFQMVDSYHPSSSATFWGNAAAVGVRGKSNHVKYAPKMYMAYIERGQTKLMERSTSGTWSNIGTVGTTAEGNLVVDNGGVVHLGWMLSGAVSYKHGVSTDAFATPDTIRTVTLVGSVGMSVDSNGQVHAAYTDGDDVFFRQQTGGVYGPPVTVRAVSQSSNAGMVDLAIDGSNHDHIVYQSPDSMSVSSLYYSENTAGNFATTSNTVLGMQGSGTCPTPSILPRIAATRAGKVYIAYTCDDVSVVTTNVSGSWVSTALTFNGPVKPAIVLDRDENPYVAYRNYVSGNVDVYWGANFAANWHVGDGISRSSDPIFAIDDQKTMHVITQDPGFTIKHRWRTATGQLGVEDVVTASGPVPLYRSIGIVGTHGQANH